MPFVTSEWLRHDQNAEGCVGKHCDESHGLGAEGSVKVCRVETLAIEPESGRQTNSARSWLAPRPRHDSPFRPAAVLCRGQDCSRFSCTAAVSREELTFRGCAKAGGPFHRQAREVSATTRPQLAFREVRYPYGFVILSGVDRASDQRSRRICGCSSEILPNSRPSAQDRSFVAR